MKPEPPTSPFEGSVFALWEQALQIAYSTAKAARLAELRGDRRVKSFDGRGVHVYSQEWGRIFACEDLMPSLGHFRYEDDVDPLTLRRHAERDAEAEFEAAAREGKGLWHGST